MSDIGQNDNMDDGQFDGRNEINDQSKDWSGNLYIGEYGWITIGGNHLNNILVAVVVVVVGWISPNPQLYVSFPSLFFNYCCL